MTIAPKKPNSKRGRPSVSKINREAIVKAALKLIDANGVSALNMRRLATSLKLDSPASIYNYFQNKKELERAIARHIVAGVTEPPESENVPWQVWTVEAAAAYHMALLQHPNAIPLMNDIPPRDFTPQTYKHAAKDMSASNLTATQIEDLFLAYESLAMGSAWAENSAYGAGQNAAKQSKAKIKAQRHAKLDQWYRRSCKAILLGLLEPSVE